MNYMSIKEASALWGVSQQMIRRYCREGRITGAIQKDGGWAVPINANKPGQPAVIAPPKELKDFAKHVVYQHEKNYHFGIYEYIQVNLAYSSNRMASNRLTRVQVMDAYRTNRVSVAFEPMKIDDVIETVNHFLCMRYVIDNLATPLNAAFIKKLHYILFYGTYSDRKDKNRVGAFRTDPGKMGIPAGNIVKELNELLIRYEKQKKVDFDKILDFHAHFEHIHPFDDGNGRLGRVIMMKECLRHGVDPFIIDDKRRNQYYKGIASWDTDPEVLRTVCREAQTRFQGQMELCRLMQYCRMPNY